MKILRNMMNYTQKRMGHLMLNVNRRMPKLALYGETGRMPLLIEILRNVFKYWL
jgi:hypothetical protein